jgi:hypothetical protein
MTLVVKQKDKKEDTVANLRSGAAAANAVALMQGKGIGTSRRSQFCLTPGTVKLLLSMCSHWKEIKASALERW